MGTQHTQLPRAGVELERDVVGVKPCGPMRHKRAERMLSDDPVKDLRAMDGEVRWDVHVAGPVGRREGAALSPGTGTMRRASF